MATFGEIRLFSKMQFVLISDKNKENKSRKWILNGKLLSIIQSINQSIRENI